MKHLKKGFWRLFVRAPHLRHVVCFVLCGGLRRSGAQGAGYVICAVPESHATKLCERGRVRCSFYMKRAERARHTPPHFRLPQRRRGRGIGGRERCGLIGRAGGGVWRREHPMLGPMHLLPCSCRARTLAQLTWGAGGGGGEEGEGGGCVQPRGTREGECPANGLRGVAP